MPLTANRTATALVLTPQAVGRTAVPPRRSPFDVGGATLTDLVRVVLTLTLVGVLVLAVEPLVAGDGRAASDHRVLQTPYGSVRVGAVTVVAVVVGADKGPVGGGHAAHAGAASGVRVNVPLTLENDSDATVRYRPGDFRLEAGGAQAVGAQDNPLLTGALRPGAAVSLRLTFPLPAEASSARLVVDGGPADGLDLALPAAVTPGQQMTPQDAASASPAPTGGHGH